MLYTKISNKSGVVNIILGGRTDDASSANLNQTNDALLIDADGYIGGIQMTLHHGNDFSIKLTDDALHSDFVTKNTILLETTLAQALDFSSILSSPYINKQNTVMLIY